MTIAELPTAAELTALHDRLLADAAWPGAVPTWTAALKPADLWHWVLVNHRFNCRLWAEEDLARRTAVADREIAAKSVPSTASTRPATTPPSAWTRCC